MRSWVEVLSGLPTVSLVLVIHSTTVANHYGGFLAYSKEPGMLHIFKVRKFSQTRRC